ncbi:MAG: aceE [Frankiales bacterium]|nr:aceE [Frankiales bacterium]
MASEHPRYTEISDGLLGQVPDQDVEETAEWLESLDALTEAQGEFRARYILRSLIAHAREQGISLPPTLSTDYINTIPPQDEPEFPGDLELERKIRAYVRWNAAVMVTRANRPEVGVGGHIATFASSATLYEVAHNHFYKGKDGNGSGDQVYFQGHASPGMYSRAYVEGRLSADALDGFRQEVSREASLPSYPHPRLMPEFWEFPTVSMGLGPINSIYQARFNRYLTSRGIKDCSDSRVWCYLGDGEMDEIESIGPIGLASREELDNLTWVVNCNLQRLDGPVRGNGKIVQELETIFRGAGWHVIKLLWGSEWDELFAKDTEGLLVKALGETPDGQMQTYTVSTGAHIREDLFGRDPRLLAMVAGKSDEELVTLIQARGGHDVKKVYAAYRAATEHKGQPTVILAQTVKGWKLGSGFEARNATHQMKKLTKTEVKVFRDRLGLEIPDDQLEAKLPPYIRPAEGSPELEYMLARRRELGGSLPKRTTEAKALAVPHNHPGFADLRAGSGNQAVATTMAIVRLIKDLVKDKTFGARFVPIIPDEARTFGLDSIFPSAKIYSPKGQTYEPVDGDLLLSYRESTSGQILHEGINEAGSMASFVAAGSSYATHSEHMIPLYIFYSMFGWQRTGDQMWLAADQLARGFLLGATAGRTTLNGEGLQHEDGHSLLIAATNPACVSYDPAFAFEISYILEDGLERMYGENAEDIFYYLTIYNEPMVQPAEPPIPGLRESVVKGLYRYSPAQSDQAPRAQILASGTGMAWALKAQELLRSDWGVEADVWSATSWNELRREAVACDDWNMLHPDEPQRTPYVTQCLADTPGPVVCVSDWMRAVPDQIRPWVQHDYTSLGTDGFGRSDTRAALRRFFRVDAESITLAVLTQLAKSGEVRREVLAQAIGRYGL